MAERKIYVDAEDYLRAVSEREDKIMAGIDQEIREVFDQETVFTNSKRTDSQPVERPLSEIVPPISGNGRLGIRG